MRVKPLKQDCSRNCLAAKRPRVVNRSVVKLSPSVARRNLCAAKLSQSAVRRRLKFRVANRLPSQHLVVNRHRNPVVQQFYQHPFWPLVRNWFGSPRSLPDESFHQTNRSLCQVLRSRSGSAVPINTTETSLAFHAETQIAKLSSLSGFLLFLEESNFARTVWPSPQSYETRVN